MLIFLTVPQLMLRLTVAYKASAYLEQLLQGGAILPEESAELDQIYADYSASHSPSATSVVSKPQSLDKNASTTLSDAQHPTSEPEHETDSNPSSPSPPLLLTREAVPALIKVLDLPPTTSFAAEVYRALEQARLRLDKIAGTASTTR